MATTKRFSDNNEKTTMASADILPFEQISDETDKKITFGNLNKQILHNADVECSNNQETPSITVKLKDNSGTEIASSTVAVPLNTVNGEINGIKAKIPSSATESNKLADKEFVNSSIATNTANFKGTFDTLAELEAVTGATNNDYGFVKSTDSTGNTSYKRYKYNASEEEWVYEYDLNNSSFTADQWGAINSGISSSLVADIHGVADVDCEVDADTSCLTVILKKENGTVVSSDTVTLPSSSGGGLFVCETAGNVTSKVLGNFNVSTGMSINVQFTHGHTAVATKLEADGTTKSNKVSANYPTLNIGGTDYPIKVGGEYAGEGFVNDGEIHEFIFDGTCFHDKDAVNIYAGEVTESNIHSVYRKERDKHILQGLRVKNNTTTNNIYYPVPYNSKPIATWNREKFNQDANGWIGVYTVTETYCVLRGDDSGNGTALIYGY